MLYNSHNTFSLCFCLLKIVETHNINIPKHIEKLKKQNCNDIDQAGNSRMVVTGGGGAGVEAKALDKSGELLIQR